MAWYPSGLSIQTYMRLLDPTYIRDIVDYSFGDESGKELPDGYMKPANSSNQEFINKYWDCVNASKPYMTLFIDNMRLYRRSPITYTAMEEMNSIWKDIRNQKLQSLADQDLLLLLRSLPNMQFVIFTGFEDVPTDQYIFDVIPDNVIGIWASNAQVYGRKVHPIPYGLQRILGPTDQRQPILHQRVSIPQTIQPSKLLYINHRVANHSSRQGINDHYQQFSWVTIHEPISIAAHHYNTYLDSILSHKFMLCPSGNAPGCECHRDIECLYMRRVPIVEDTPYHHIIFKQLNAPVLYVTNLLDITEQLLIDNDYLYQQMQEYDMNNLDIELLYNRCIKHASQIQGATNSVTAGA